MSEPTSNSASPHRMKKIYFSLLWLFPAILSANSFYLRAITRDQPASWFSIFAVQLLVWSIWAGFTPLILWLGRKFRIERPHWWRGSFFHVFSSIALVLVYLVFYIFIFGWVNDADVNWAWFKAMYINFFIALFHWDILIYWSILGIGYAFEYYNKYRERELQALQLEKQLVQAQLQALKMQLQPHFLFNTLHTIGGLVRHDQKKAAVKMLAGLSDLLRSSLDHVGKQEISLKEELEFLESYLDIQQTRFQDRLKVEMNVAPESLDARVPVLILQPIVENAIRHGLDKSKASGRLEITTRKNNGFLEVEIHNDGPRLPEGWHFTKSQGLGLRNTAERLRQLYGSSSKLELTNAERGGVIARLSLPFSPDSKTEEP